MKQSNISKSENGSVLTFGIGLAILLLMLVSVSVNLAALWITKATLRTIADGAALSGAQAVDVAGVYKHGVQGAVRLSPRLARFHVERYLDQTPVRKRVHGLRVVKITVAGDQVKVILACDPQLPFGYLLPTQISRIQAVAMARQETSK